MWFASIPAAASISAGLPEVGISRTPIRVTLGCVRTLRQTLQNGVAQSAFAPVVLYDE